MPNPLATSRLLTAFVLLLLVRIGLSVIPIDGGLQGLATLTLIVLGAILLIRGLMRPFIWRLRNRLYVTYVFIGVVPIALILILVGIGAYIVAGQIAVSLVSSELDRRIAALRGPAQFLTQTTPQNRADVVRGMGPFLRGRLPDLGILIHGREDFRYPPNSAVPTPPPGWKDYCGLVFKDGLYYGFTHVSTGPSQVVMLAPVTRELLSGLIPNLGDVVLANTADAATELSPKHHGKYLSRPYNSFDRRVAWGNPVTVAYWDDPGKTKTAVLVVGTRPSALLGAIFSADFPFGQTILFGLVSVAILFLIVEIVSLIIGISLTRTITRAVHNLYLGTERIASGDFGHRIEVRGRDQLAELGASFNGMTEHLERLIVVEKEKERLQSELEIAKEVQFQLFPKAVPTLRTLELTGICQPARMVSGDYYDFLCLQNNVVALAIGDVAGKGISAALLMAAIQSIMRTQLADAPPASFSTSHMVSQLNKQLYANTSPEKYATFCFGLYDEDRQTLTYTNAGHLQPILLRNGASIPLEVTGTVVGLFPMSTYEEKTIPLIIGDMLVAYTDGISEPENEYGEEFGIDRIVELILKHQNVEGKEIIARVMEAVRNWNKAAELPDDMTILLARRT
ncbi:MAG: PP2C family protein-serine/threonine phosphatase [Acidobacteriota bacterium]|nr:PP2C family protein-serine/threonine phosphatase [Acidobacteriota bacterium]